MNLSPGSKVLDLTTAPSGHMLLPVSEFDKLTSEHQRYNREHTREGDWMYDIDHDFATSEK